MPEVEEIPEDKPHFLDACSFCHQPTKHIYELVVGPQVSICSTCVEIARDAIGYGRECARLKKAEEEKDGDSSGR